MNTFKLLTDNHKKSIINEVKMMLFKHRDTLWTKHHNNPGNSNPTLVSFEVNDGSYGEAFGIMRALRILGYGYFGPSNLNAVAENKGTVPEHNLLGWLAELEQEVLTEDGFYDKTTSATKTKKLLDKYHQLHREAS